jgi:hypothetical protein
VQTISLLLNSITLKIPDMKKSFIEQFTLNPKFPKLAIAIIMLIVIVGIFQPFFDNGVNYEIAVKPNDIDKINDKPLAAFAHSEVQIKGNMIIKNPGFIDRILFGTNETSSLLTCVAFLIILIVLFLSSDKLQFKNPDVFRKDLWKPVMIIGAILFTLCMLNIVKDFVAKELVSRYTNNQFTVDEKFTHWVQFWAGLLLINFGVLFKKGFELQRDQDLTV